MPAAKLNGQFWWLLRRPEATRNVNNKDRFQMEAKTAGIWTRD